MWSDSLKANPHISALYIAQLEQLQITGILEDFGWGYDLIPMVEVAWRRKL